MSKPSAKLEALALKALRADIAAKKAVEEAKEAKLDFMVQAEQEGMLNQDTHAVGVVRTTISANRYFDLDTAIELVTEQDVLESTVEVVDEKLLKEHMTPIQMEKAMKLHDNPWKVGFKVNK